MLTLDWNENDPYRRNGARVFAIKKAEHIRVLNIFWKMMRSEGTVQELAQSFDEFDCSTTGIRIFAIHNMLAWVCADRHGLEKKASAHGFGLPYGRRTDIICA